MHLKLQKRSTCGISLVKLGEVEMKFRLGWGSSSFRQGDALQTRPVLGVAARSTDRKRSSFLDEHIADWRLRPPLPPEVVSLCARDGVAGGRPEQT